MCVSAVRAPFVCFYFSSCRKEGRVLQETALGQRRRRCLFTHSKDFQEHQASLKKNCRSRSGAPAALDTNKRAVRRAPQQASMIVSSRPAPLISLLIPRSAAVLWRRVRRRAGLCRVVCCWWARRRFLLNFMMLHNDRLLNLPIRVNCFNPRNFTVPKLCLNLQGPPAPGRAPSPSLLPRLLCRTHTRQPAQLAASKGQAQTPTATHRAEVSLSSSSMTCPTGCAVALRADRLFGASQMSSNSRARLQSSSNTWVLSSKV